MTAIEMIDFVFSKLRAQGQACMTEPPKEGYCGQCAYSDGEGNHCAVGHLLSEVALKIVKEKELDHEDVIMLKVRGIPVPLPTDMDEDGGIYLLLALQEAHDCPHSWVHGTFDPDNLRYKSILDKVAKRKSRV